MAFCLFLSLCPVVAQTDCAVEHEVVWGAVLVEGEISQTLELEIVERLELLEILLDVAILAYLERTRVEEFSEVALVG